MTTGCDQDFVVEVRSYTNYIRCVNYIPSCYRFLTMLVWKSVDIMSKIMRSFQLSSSSAEKLDVAYCRWLQREINSSDCFCGCLWDDIAWMLLTSLSKLMVDTDVNIGGSQRRWSVVNVTISAAVVSHVVPSLLLCSVSVFWWSWSALDIFLGARRQLVN